MNQTNQILVSEEEVGERLDAFLSKKLDLPRNQIQNILKDQKISINNSIAKKSHICELGDEVKFQDNVLSPELVTSDLEIDILFEDEDLLVINKPAGLIVHPNSVYNSKSDQQDTLVNRLLHHYPNIKNVGEDPLRPGIVHRLDRDTTGVMIVVKTQEAFVAMKQILKDREVERKYIAIVENLFPNTRGTIDAPIGNSGQGIKFDVVIDGKFARTHYRVLQNIEESNVSIIECKLETGRTHQIRVHMSAIGHKVLGDYLYNPNSRFKAPRTMLHSHSLKFTHFKTGKEIKVVCEVPKDFYECDLDFNMENFKLENFDSELAVKNV